MEQKVQVGDLVRIKRFEPNIDEGDTSPLTIESTLKTDHIGRRKEGDVFSYNEAILLGCSMAIENVLSYGPEAAPVRGDPDWTYAVEHAVAAYFISRIGLREALAERIPFGITLVVYPCGASTTIPTGERALAGCRNDQCDRCYPKEPRWAVLCGLYVDGKMGIENLVALDGDQ